MSDSIADILSMSRLLIKDRRGETLSGVKRNEILYEIRAEFYAAIDTHEWSEAQRSDTEYHTNNALRTYSV